MIWFAIDVIFLISYYGCTSEYCRLSDESEDFNYLESRHDDIVHDDSDFSREIVSYTQNQVRSLVVLVVQVTKRHVNLNF